MFFSESFGSYLHVVHRLTALVGVLGVPEQHEGHALALASLRIPEDRYPENGCVQISQKGTNPTCLCRLPHYRTVLFKDLPQIDVGKVERQVGHVRRVPDGIACGAAHDFVCKQFVPGCLQTNLFEFRREEELSTYYTEKNFNFISLILSQTNLDLEFSFTIFTNNFEFTRLWPWCIIRNFLVNWSWLTGHQSSWQSHSSNKSVSNRSQI